MNTKEIWQCRVAPSLGGGFSGTPSSVWGTEEYTDKERPCVFFGLYGLPDFYSVWRHKGRRAVLWAGSDIRHLLGGYWLSEGGSVRLPVRPLARWLKENCEHYVENEAEENALGKYGIRASVVPSFLGDVRKFPLAFKWNGKVNVYTSVSGDDFTLYGWDEIPDIARRYPDFIFHLYGNRGPWSCGLPNVFVYGRVPQERMDKDTKTMNGSLRLTKFEGFSEIVAKSLLWGQWPVSRIQYPNTISVEDLGSLRHKRTPNKKGSEMILAVLNRYPWNINGNPDDENN